MFEETEELVVAVPVLAQPGHLPGDDFQDGEQGDGAMADVVVVALLVVTRLGVSDGLCKWGGLVSKENRL